MNRSITRVALVIISVIGIFALSFLTVRADPELPIEELPPADNPGPRVAFRLSPMPKLVFLNGEPFELKFTAIPITGAILVWDFDVSTLMTDGSNWLPGNALSPEQKSRVISILQEHGIPPNPEDPFATLREVWRSLSQAEKSALLADLQGMDFRYEPWSSALEMLQRFWTETGLCDGLVAVVEGPGGSRMFHYPCLDPAASLAALDEHQPTGWYTFTRGLTETIELATAYAHRGYVTEVYVVNRGARWPEDRQIIPWVIDRANEAGIRIHVVPMGNEPGPPTYFPDLKSLEELARGTGGNVYYEPNFEDIYDFSMLLTFAPRMARDFFARIVQVDQGTRIATEAVLVITPSDYVRIISPRSPATDTRSVRIPFRNLVIGQPQSAELGFQVNTTITGTLLPVFDAENTYLEWRDLAGASHRVPLPQRVISVTDDITIIEPPPTSEPPTPTAQPTRPPRPTATASFTPSPIPSATATPTPLPTATVTYTPSPTATPRPTRTPRPTHTPRPTRTPLPTNTPTLFVRPSHTYQVFVVPVLKHGMGGRWDPYPAPTSQPRVEIPFLDGLFRWLLP